MRWNPPLLVVILALTACPPTEKVPTESAIKDTGPEVCDIWTTGQAPWDPLRLETCAGEPLEPLVLDATGAAVPVTPLAWRGELLGWVPAEDLPAGDYNVVGFSGEDRGLDAPFTVLPFGQDVAFSAAEVLDRTWQIDLSSLWVAVPDGLGEMAASELADQEEVFLRVRPGDGEDVTLELVMQMQASGAQCVLLRDTATLSATGELRWTLDELSIETDAGEVQAWNIALHLGWLADGSAGGGLEGSATVNTAALSSWIFESDDPLEACNLLYGTGLTSSPCYRCTIDGPSTCLDLRAYAGTLQPVDVEIASDLPMCGLDLEEDVDGDLPSFDCDMPEIDLDCGCQAPLTRGAALPFSIGLLAFLRSRRKRR